LPYAATRLRQKASPGFGIVHLARDHRSRENPPCNLVRARRCRVHRIPPQRS
jgi:hypothetical protein